MALFGSRAKRSIADPQLAQIRQALVFGTYRVAIKGGGASDFMLHRLVSDDYRYLAGVVLATGGFCVYAESPTDQYVQLVTRRDDADRQWREIKSTLATQIDADPDTEELPNLSRHTGWAWFRGLSPDTVMADHFSHSTGVRACLREIADDNVRLYVEYRERGLEKYFDNADLARTALSALQAGTQGFSSDLRVDEMRPKRFLPTATEATLTDVVLSLGGRVSRGGSAFAWGTMSAEEGQMGWAFLHHYGGRIVLPFRTPDAACAFLKAMDAGNNESTMKVDRLFG
ncbi:MAG TPA: hypothetical protein DGT23_01375 [Micromonosporaceae bacterium]|nr:hypothetical protein [Micromonosporaceae bacterium]